MRKRLTESGLTVNAVAGTHVVLLGLDSSKQKRKRCLGFAIKREDHTEEESYWLSGMKTFKSTEPDIGPGGQVSTRHHPLQSFQWSDYSAKPEHDYTYTVLPLYDSPANLREGDAVSVKVRTESEGGDKHSVFFNRGAVASQEYARRFLNQAPDQVAGGAAYRWLSRGLLEALLKFLSQAKNQRYAIYGAVYEFQWPEVLQKLSELANSGSTVQILYDAIPGNGPAAKNLAAIEAAGIKNLCVERKKGKLMHNKFFVLAKDERPVAVWTGSTNLTENGIFGHSNCGHMLNDKTAAKTYLEYWLSLKEDPDSKATRTWVGGKNIAPPNPWDKAETVVFSPRTGLKVLQWYADIAGATHKPLFMTFAFGMHKYFQAVYEQDDDILRFALMEKEGNGSGLANGKKDVARIRARENVVVAVAKNITMNSFDRWLKERDKINPKVHVKFIHTKYMLIDPLGETPVVATGSANFSEASTNTNDENMVVIQNNPRVADIYLGEFMRLYSHYAFREAVAFHQNGPQEWQPSYLKETDEWQKDYFTPGHQRFLRREYFAGV